jgi:hypothetical protein
LLIGTRIVTGTIVVFDDYMAYRGWKEGEQKAWTEFIAQRGLRYEYIAFAWQGVAIRVL